MDSEKIKALRMERQFLTRRANEEEYRLLYRDTQPGLSVYWNGFGEPPCLSFRADFDDTGYNRERQEKRELVKGRFAGGNLGWVEREETELFVCLYRSENRALTLGEEEMLELVRREGPISIQQIKEDTGLLVKEITPALHKLQECFLIYEDQYDGGWDRGWYVFEEMFPDVNIKRYTRIEALKKVLVRFAYRNVLIDTDMARSFYVLPKSDIERALYELTEERTLVAADGAYILATDSEILNTRTEYPDIHGVYAVHRNDFFFKSFRHLAEKRFKPYIGKREYECDPLQYLLIDGEIRGLCIGRYRYGPADINDVICDLPDAGERRDEILKAVQTVNAGSVIKRFMGEDL